MNRVAPLSLIVLFPPLFVWACSAAGNNTDPGAGGLGGQGGTGATAAGGATTSSQGLGGGFAGGLNVGGGGAGEPLVDEVFGQSATVLYRLDPQTNELDAVGPFNGCSNVIDIAIDKDSQIFATTSSGLFRVNPTNAQCTQIATGEYPNSLSFVPKGTLDANTEALVGYYESQYVRIDTSSGAISNIGTLGGGFASSGDIVSVIDGGTYLTVYGPGCSDCLLEVNPATGDMVRNWGPLSHDNVFGLAYWGGRAYGFNSDGDLFEITFGATSVSTITIQIPGAPSNLSFWGAGSSTAVPVHPPT